MTIKAMVVSTNELIEAFRVITKKEKASIKLTVNEETEKDVAVIKEKNVATAKEIEIESVLSELSEIFEVQIKSYEGYDYPEFADLEGGYVFLFS